MKRVLSLVTAMGLLSFVGCGGGDSADAPSPEDNPSQPEDWAWRFKVVASGQGYAGSSAYTPGNAVVVCPLHVNAIGEWDYGTDFDTAIMPVDRLPPAVPFPYDESTVQLVALFTISHNTTATYSNGMSFQHETCHVELREALTARFVASSNFQGANNPPSTVTGRPGASISDVETMAPAISAWIAAFY